MLNLVCFIEEPSAKNVLKVILPKILPRDIDIKYVVFEGKQDLEKQIQRKIQHYNVPNAVFLILRDQDQGNCYEIKQSLEAKVRLAGKLDQTLIRIACRELESFFLGDLQAVEVGLKLTGLAKQQEKRKFRVPDCLQNPATELKKATQKKYSKLAGSRAIAPHLNVHGNNRSTSFNVLISGVQKIMQSQINLS